MYLISAVPLFVLLLDIIHAQSFTCSCSCCIGAGCQPAYLGTTAAQECTNTACVAACRARFYQCPGLSTAGQAIGQCATATTTTTIYTPTTGGPYSCRCNCCNTGTYTCTPAMIGFSNAYSCNSGACSIACANQYPYVCVNNYLGQTQGECNGLTSPTPPTPSGSSRCGCSCRTPNGNQYYEVTTGSGCSACLSACSAMQLQCSPGSYQNTYCTN